MQLREIHIDGFGTFCNKHVTGLSSGINVIHGPNEAGKSTLLAFIRRILFGFPRKSTESNPYPLLKGGAYGGRLVCYLADGKIAIISRMERKGLKEGLVKIAVDSTELIGQEHLNKILDNIGDGFYQNVYAIDLDILGSQESLQDKEIESHICGAGLGLGNISLNKIKEELTGEADKFFKSGGSAQEIPKLYKIIDDLAGKIKETKKGLSGYHVLVSQYNELEGKVNLNYDEIRRSEKEERKLENQERLYERYVELKNARDELSKLEILPLFRGSALSELETLKDNIAKLDVQIEGETEELTGLEFDRDQLDYDEQIIASEPDIISLHGQSTDYRKSLNDIKEQELIRKGYDEDITEGIERVGHGWTTEDVGNFKLTVQQEDKIRTTKASLDDVERKLQGQSKGLSAPGLLKYSIYFFTALGLISAVSGFVADQTLVTVLSTTIFVVGVGLTLFMILSKRPNQEYQKLLQVKRILLNEWHEFLRSVNFDRDLTPDGAKELVDKISDIKRQLGLLRIAKSRIDSMQSTIDEVAKLHNKVAAFFDESKITDDKAANIGIFWRFLEEIKETKRKKVDLIRRITRLNSIIEDLKKKKRQADEELQSFISSFGAKDEVDFRSKYDTFSKAKEQKKIIDKAKEIIQPTVGTDEQYASFIEAISATNPDEIKSKLLETRKKLNDKRSEIRDDNIAIAEKKTEIKQLSSSEDLLKRQSDLEIKKQQLCNFASDWIIPQIALFVLDRAISKYEMTGQSDVIKAAQNIFAHVTKNKYPTIPPPTETKEIKIEDDARNRKGRMEMSRGTKEQLYFAMRLGFIEVYEKEREPMPIIMDDILVNFDDERGPLAVKELANFAKDRQVIILTCHENTLDLYKKLGANEVILA